MNIFFILFLNSCKPDIENALRHPVHVDKIPKEEKKQDPSSPPKGEDSSKSSEGEEPKKDDLPNVETKGDDPLPESAKSMSFAYKGSVFPAEWASALLKGVPELVPELIDENFLTGKARADIVSMCADYFEATDAQKPEFWALFIASIAYPESGYKPTTVFREPAPLNENSVGLLQLSTSNASHGEACRFKSESELKKAVPNLRCGLLIVKNQVKKHHALFTPGYFYYWSVLRNKPAVIRDVFLQNVEKLSFCKKK